MNNLHLTTPRLLLRELYPTDLPAIALMNSGAEFIRYERDEPRTTAQLRGWLETLEDDRRAEPRRQYSLGITLLPDPEVIGSVGLYTMNREIREWEIGWGIREGYWNRGIASEAARAMLDFARRTLNAHRVAAFCHVDNAASARVMEKIGMTREGQLKQVRWLGGQWHDELVYAVILNP